MFELTMVCRICRKEIVEKEILDVEKPLRTNFPPGLRSM